MFYSEFAKSTKSIARSDLLTPKAPDTTLQPIADLSVDEFIRKASKNLVRVRSPQASDLRDLIVGPDVTVETVEPGVLEVVGLTAEQIGDAAAEHGFAIHELTPQHASLEEAFMDLTREDVEYRAGQAASEPEVVA